MTLQYIRTHTIKINFKQYTQIANITPQLGNDIYNYIVNYFGNHKYTEDDLRLYNGHTPSILLNDVELSKKHFICIGINNINDIDKVLEHKKDSLLMNYSKMLLETIEIQNEIDNLEQIYNKIVQMSQDLFPENSIVKIDEITVNIESLLNKNISPFISKNYSAIDKLKQIVSIIRSIGCNGDKFILYLHNIETYLAKEDVLSIQLLASSIDYLTLIISSSNPSYFDYTMVEDINFLYNDKIYDLPNMEILEKKLNMNIEKFISLNQTDIIKFLQHSSFSVITNENSYDENYNLMYKAILTDNPNKNGERICIDFCTIL